MNPVPLVDLLPVAIEVAYRQLAITILGLDVCTLTAELSRARLATEVQRCEEEPVSLAARFAQVLSAPNHAGAIMIPQLGSSRALLARTESNALRPRMRYQLTEAGMTAAPSLPCPGSVSRAAAPAAGLLHEFQRQ